MKVRLLTVLNILFTCCILFPAVLTTASEPIRVIFDSDMGSDVDDGLALSELHALANRGAVEILAETSSNGHPFVPRYLRMLNSYYGRASIPVGMAVDPPNVLESNHMGPTLDQLEKILVTNPDLPAPEEPAVPLLRRTLAESPDKSVTVIMTGFATNLGGLLDSPADSISPFTGKELIAQKVSVLYCIAGNFIDELKDHVENNIRFDIPAARRVADDWPTPIIWSGCENGRKMIFSREFLERAFATMPNSPAYLSCMFYGVPYMALWDLLPPLYLVSPDLFRLSEPGRVTIREDGTCYFTPEENGRDRHIMFLNDEESAAVTEAYRWLVSEPPIYR